MGEFPNRNRMSHTKKKVIEHWCLPDSGWIKINCDGAYYVISKDAGIGAVVRNSASELIVGKGRHFATDTPLLAEAEALKLGVS